MSRGQPEKMKPVLDFTLNQSENEPQLGEVIFSGFCAEERETEGEQSTCNAGHFEFPTRSAERVVESQRLLLGEGKRYFSKKHQSTL